MKKIKEVFPRILSKKSLPVALLALFPMIALAAEPVPSLSQSLMALLGAIKDHAVAAVVIMHVFQILRSNEAIGILGKLGLSGKTLQVAIAVLTALGYVAEAYARGGNLVSAAIEGLFTSGGAMLIYDAVKNNTVAVASNPLVAASALAISMESSSKKA